MEEQSKISFLNKIRISVLKIEEYQKLAVQKVGKTIGYLAKLMLIFAFVLTLFYTYNFSKVVNNIKQYVETEISDINFENNKLTVISNKEPEKPIIIENEILLNGKIIIDTNDITNEQINSYINDVKTYSNGIVLLKDKLILKTAMTAVSSNIPYENISEQYNIVKLDKQDITNMLSGSNVWMLYLTFFIVMFIYLFIIYFSTVLVDALLYSLLGYITGIIARLRLKFSATYNIAVHALTLPIILNLIYISVNSLTGYTIKYFDIMYMAITCIYIITAILMIKSDVIKKQIELSRIISEQEKVKQELERQEQERKEEEEKERIRKEDEKKRKEEKEREKEQNDKTKSKENTDKGLEDKPKTKRQRKPRQNNTPETPEPQANIKPSNL